MESRIINGKIHLIGKISPLYSKNKNKDIVKKDFKSFSELLKVKQKETETEQFKISNHALQRLKMRNIQFDENDMKAINEGINIAKDKGSRESVIFYKNVVLVTSITNRTVITAMEKEKGKNVFTNIDSVVLL